MESVDVMNKKSLIGIVFITFIIFAGNSYVWGSDVSNLINTKFFDSSIEKAISEGALSGHYGNLNKAIYYLNSESKPDQKAALDFIAWINLVNASRMLAASYRDSEGILKDAIRSTIAEESRQIDSAVLDVGQNRLGWSKDKVQEMYDICRKRLEDNLNQKPADSAVSKPPTKPVEATTAPQDRIIGAWKADIGKSKNLPESKEYAHLFDKGNKLYFMKWARMKITDKEFDLSFTGGPRFQSTYTVVSQKGPELAIELENKRKHIFKLKMIDDTHVKLLGPQGMVMVFRAWDKSKEGEQKDPEELMYIIRGHNSAAMSDLKNAYTAQQAYNADHSTYTKSIEGVKKAGLNLTEGVKFSIIEADANKLTMEAFHDRGDKIYIINQDGEIEERMVE